MFCPKCGSEDEELYNGVCRSCFINEAKIVEIPADLELTICAHCNSLLKGIKWEDNEISEEDLVSEVVLNNLKPLPYVEDLTATTEIMNIKGTLFECVVQTEGHVFGTSIIEKHNVTVKINKGVCPDCSKYASGYFESVIQIRADKRFPSNEEIEKIDNIIRSKTAALSIKNRMAYISDVNILKEGVDYYVGSYKAARKLVSAVRDVMGGVMQESPRIVGRDKSRGKDLYRIWISLRLPEFLTGDFIRYHDRVGLVKGFDGKKILLEDLEDNMWSVLWKEYNKIEVIANSSDVKTTNVTSKTPRTIQILHPDTYQPVDIQINSETSKLNIGDEIRVLELDGNLHILVND